MSLFDKASLVFSGKAAAGKDKVAYNIKPVEKLKVDELITNNKLLTSDGWAFSDSNITVANGKIVFNEPAQYATARWDTDVFVEGKTYKISFKVEDFGGGASNSKLLAQQANNTQIDTNIDRDGKYSFYYTPGAPDGTNNQNRFQLKTVTDSVKAKVSDFSIKEVEQKANDFTFTRGSNLTATLEGADGLIKKGRENALQYSNDYSVSNSDGGWTKNNASVTSGQSGYDGSTDAFKLESTTSTSFNNINQFQAAVPRISDLGDKVSTFSVYLKKGNTDWARLNLNGTGNAYFDLDGDGAVGTVTANVIAKIEEVSSGWFRCSVTRTGGGTFTGVYVYIAESDDNLLASNHGTAKHIFVQDAQLEYGLVATPYIDRTAAAYSTAGVLENEPRYDYSGGDATLLLEPERQNLVPRSEYFTLAGRTTITYNHGTSPEGFKNSTKFTNTTELGAHRTNTGNFNLTEGETYTASLFAKKGTLKKISFRLLSSNESSKGDDGSTEIGFDEAIFDLNDGSISGASTNASMVDYGNGWYRCIMTDSVAEVVTDARMYVYFREDDGTKAYTGATSENMEIYGAQVEKGPYATSYIPTYGSAATREGEGDSLSSFTCTLDTPLSKKYTLFLDLQVDNLERPTTNFDDIFVARAADGNNYAFRLEGYYDPAPNPDTYSLRAFMYKSGESFAFLSTDHTNGIQLGVRNKIAIVFDEEVGVKVFHNGAIEKEKLEAASFYDVKFLEGGSQPRSKTLLHGVQAYDVALSDPECVSLTTI